MFDNVQNATKRPRTPRADKRTQEPNGGSDTAGPSTNRKGPHENGHRVRAKGAQAKSRPSRRRTEVKKDGLPGVHVQPTNGTGGAYVNVVVLDNTVPEGWRYERVPTGGNHVARE